MKPSDWFRLAELVRNCKSIKELADALEEEAHHANEPGKSTGMVKGEWDPWKP